MSEEYRSGQGSIIPALFVGIGGVGSRIVDRISSRAAHLPNWETQLRPLTSFVSIDTNELDQHKLRNIPEGNRLNIAAFDKAKAIGYFRKSNDAQALQWLDPRYQPRPGFKPGAGQIRVESRLGFFFHSQEIRQRLKALVQESLRPGITWRQSNPPKFNVYLFCTLGGGTGSGSFLSTAYLLESVLQEQNWQPRIIANLLLSTLMLDKVGPELHPDIHANTYAALKELEHLTKLDYPEVKREGRTSDQFVYCRDENNRAVQVIRGRPAFVSFIFDRPPHLGLPDAESAIADAAYLQIFTPIIDNLAGELDNYEKNLEGLTHFPGDLKNVGQGYTKNFGAYGAAAMVLPASDLLEYCAARFAAQAIRSQITFSVDSSDPADDRARALAKLAVDYSDPKFRTMSDEDREHAIHQSFVSSVQEMARQDKNMELLGGFWIRLVETADDGRQTGVDEQGEAIRGESLAQLVERKLEESRRDLLNKISIKERAFVFHREGVNQYIELVSRLLEDIRAARMIVDEGARGLEAAAGEGEAITDLKLDPIAERYLVLRLLQRCERSWIPDAQQQLEKAKARDVSNPKVRERLERELFDTLREAAAKHSMFKGDQAFLAARDEAQEYFRGVASAARKLFDAETRLRQLRSLLAYLQRRSRQYARLATRMDALVQDLEREAERLRRGETALVAPLTLRVEVFETLDEPRQRIWDGVYRALFLDGGRYLSTFDRQVLAETIAQELKPIVRADGSVVEKSVDQTESDLRRSLKDLGRDRLRPAIFGQVGQAGLDLVNGLELEARLMLQPAKPAGDNVTDDEIDEYREKKFRALSQLAGVLARVSSTESKALDDGVVSNRTRQLIVGLGEAGQARATEKFMDRLRSVLSAGGRQVKVDHWHDPRLIIVHDVELPIPLYYFEPVTGEIEDAYLHLAADERRAYNLHTDFKWEKSLPNLNPRRSEITMGWALQVLADGLLTRVIGRQAAGGVWTWLDAQGDSFEVLGPTLATALYRLGEIHRLENLQQRLEKNLHDAHHAMASETELARRKALVALVEGLMQEMDRRQLRGDSRHEDVLDRPILRALLTELGKQTEWLPKGETSEDRIYERFNLDMP
ncbi:MAG TPA: tubulin-like doman-containing protein [Thermoanaerobaculia bacterium]|nr:tubulin-like doman-containing protein [Thermoanaerobaculia bacterium]